MRTASILAALVLVLAAAPAFASERCADLRASSLDASAAAKVLERAEAGEQGCAGLIQRFLVSGLSRIDSVSGAALRARHGDPATDVLPVEAQGALRELYVRAAATFGTPEFSKAAASLSRYLASVNSSSTTTAGL
jgi:hypothetical protein